MTVENLFGSLENLFGLKTNTTVPNFSNLQTPLHEPISKNCCLILE